MFVNTVSFITLFLDWLLKRERSSSTRETTENWGGIVMSLMRVSVYNRQQTLKLSRSADESASVLEMSLHCEAIYFCFFFFFHCCVVDNWYASDFQLLEQKMLELRRLEEKSSSRLEELSQIVKVNQEVLFTFVYYSVTFWVRMGQKMAGLTVKPSIVIELSRTFTI